LGDNAAQAVADTRQWLARAVVGLNLCPFAKAIVTKDQVHFAVTAATTWNDLTTALEIEIRDLLAMGSQVRDTTLLIATAGLPDFIEFNGFLGEADRLLRRMRLQGILQIASFHPLYEFADTPGDDITNFTNRAPYPTLHLLRESSMARAVQAFPEADQIFDKNRQMLRELGAAGWAALGVGATRVPPGDEPNLTTER
jgi:uncharacterized protein